MPNSQIPAVAVAKAWAAYTNANGGLSGHQVSLDIQDTQGTPTGVQKVMAALADDKVSRDRASRCSRRGSRDANKHCHGR